MNSISSWQDLAKDIRFWIIIFFLLRLYGITFPPLEVGHNWRQTDGLMIARNFCEHRANVLYPTTDVCEDKTGIVGCEFPALNYCVYITAKIFGFQDWYGRLIVLIVSSIGTFFFFKLIKRHFGERVAFNATIILLVSLWFSYSRKNIPDTFAASLCFIALYSALLFLEEGKWWNILIYFLIGAIGCLAKVSATTLLSVLILPILNNEIRLRRKVILCIFSAGILALVYAWYFQWVPYLNNTYQLGGHFFMGMTMSEGFRDLINDWPNALKQFYSTSMKFTGFACFLFALYIIVGRKRWIQLLVFLIPFSAYMVIILKAGHNFIGNTYYVLTMVPSMAFLIGCALEEISNKKWITFILIVVALEGLSDQMWDFRVRQPYKSLESLESIMNQVSDRSELIAINAQTNNPTPMYFAHRRGWVLSSEVLNDEEKRNEIRLKGCKYIVILRKLYNDLQLPLPVVHESEYFRVYQNDVK
jgi:hypothetical protein